MKINESIQREDIETEELEEIADSAVEESTDDIFDEDDIPETELEENTESAEDDPNENENDAELEEEVPDYKALYEAEKKARETEQKRLNEALKVQGYSSLDDIFADHEGLSVDDYRKKKEDDQTLLQARKIVDAQRYAKMAEDDLAELKRAGLVPNDVKHIAELKCAGRFAELREKGLSAEEAYRASAGATLDERFDRVAKRNAASKNHLQASASRASSAQVPKMTEAEREQYRSMLHTDDDKAIESAWRRAQGRK